MKSRPILFKAEMVRAILNGSKTQTRRIVKPQPEHMVVRATPETSIHCEREMWLNADGINPGREMKCPWMPGDHLWVKETCKAAELPGGLDGVTYAADGSFREIENSEAASDRWMNLYSYGGGEGRTVPSLFMPRWASRITLEVTGVHVERLNDISEEDAIAEGIDIFEDGAGWSVPDSKGKLLGWKRNGVDAYSDLWESINGVCSWADNPWVWVISFKVCEK